MAERYKKEIEEILQQAGDLGSGGPSRSKPTFLKLVWLQMVQSLGGKTWAIRPGRVMLVAVVLLLAALLLRPTLPGIVGLLAWAGLILFIVGYAMFFIRPPKVEKRWRGETIEYGESWWSRLRRRIK